MAALAVVPVVLSVPPARAASELIRLEVASTRADAVTGGGALVRVSGNFDHLANVSANGADVTAAFRPQADGLYLGLVEGLALGPNAVTATTGRGLSATLTVTNHPISGPVFSGPHVEPFYCQTQEAGLGPPDDPATCSLARPMYQWFARSSVTKMFSELADPYSPYPPDTDTATTTEGRQVPFVVRMESWTINRGITRLGVLDDPAARGPNAPYATSSAWNRKVVFEWGPGCGVGYHQDVNSATDALNETWLGNGYMTGHSTLTTLGVHCNEVLSAETFMMIREHIAKRYGLPKFVIGHGNSGGAIQQHTTLSAYPGLEAGAVMGISFPDVVTSLKSPHDCHLLNAVYNADPARWVETKRQAVSGHRTSQNCNDYDSGLFLPLFVPTTGCDPVVLPETIYNPVTNPAGVRCTVADQLINVLGPDPRGPAPDELAPGHRGYARVPVDNVGVQYGMRALSGGVISVREFLDLNRSVGGIDLDGNIVPERTRMAGDLAETLYRTSRVSGRAAINEAPIIDDNLYMDLVPGFSIHDHVRPYMMRARLDRNFGSHASQAIWNGAAADTACCTSPGVMPAGVDVMDAWLTAVQADDPAKPLAQRVADNRPASAADRCTGPHGIGIDDRASYDDPGICDTVFHAQSSTRMAAGGPLDESIIKCQLKSPDPADFGAVAFTPDEWVELGQIFAEGVCDWSKPAVGQVPARTWVTFGDSTLIPGGTDMGPPPVAEAVS